jgi:hypothetical protein
MISYGLYRLLPFLYEEEELIQRHADVFVVGSILEFGLIGLFVLYLILRVLVGIIDPGE